MAKSKISGAALPNIPWQERPAGCTDVVWRYENNPVIGRHHIPCSNSIFNSAVVPHKGKFAGVFRVDDKRRASRLHVGFSSDGLNWDISNEPIQFPSDDPKSKAMRTAGGYDPRVVWIEDRYWITWCSGNHGATIGVAYTKDFKKFTQIENAFVPYNRNGVLFPRKFHGQYVMLNRPSDNGHTPFGDIFLSHSNDMVYWGKHRHVMARGLGWGWTKIGAGPIPIETPDGWLLIYHGVQTSCSGMVYSFSAALLDRDEPWKVLHRPAPYLLAPQKLYECVGDVPNVAFPCAALLDPPTGRMAIYYGGADTVVCLAFGYLQEIIDFCKRG